jgi:hypothetical protein
MQPGRVFRSEPIRRSLKFDEVKYVNVGDILHVRVDAIDRLFSDEIQAKRNGPSQESPQRKNWPR